MRIAIVGSGISGLTAAFLLNKKHDVYVFEKENWIGGHTHTLDVIENNRNLAIDTGFIVFNDKTYPYFNKLLNKLGVEKQKTTMSFSVANQYRGIEYNGTDLKGIFAQRQNILNINFIKMLVSILKLNKIAKGITKLDYNLSLADFISEYKINHYTVENYLLPMCCAIWSCEQEQMLDTPARFLFNFLNNHGMLNINDRPQWYTVKNGSKQYVNALVGSESIKFYKDSPVQKVIRTESSVKINTSNESHVFDKVIMATHANDTLTLIENPNSEEANILSCFPYQDNHVALHTDTSVLPKNRRAWAGWNYRVDEGNKQSCRLSYNMNILQNIQSKTTYCVSVNQSDLIDKNKLIAEFTYAHPVYTQSGLKAQKQQLAISGVNNIFYCGAYWRYGFHEDGVRSALHISEMLDGDSL
ncbi:FAD-dependent oxidoreductase [Gammaproteobacteria bacterium]|nr:FAD-dependent oxidoreductase [Gammaproteobacteria bacterium]